MFCDCRLCRRAASLGGKDFRTRSSILIDGILKVDFPPDTYHHKLAYGLDLNGLRTVLFTHSHFDHFSVRELDYLNKPFSHWKRKHSILFLGNGETAKLASSVLNATAPASVRTMEAFETVAAGDYKVTAIPAVHSTERPFNYIIQRGGKSLLYASDTGPYPESTMRYLGNFRFACVISECTGGLGRIDYGTHLALSDAAVFKKRMENSGASEKKTRWILTHFSHNGAGTHEEMSRQARRLGMTAAYDGMKTEI